ncbi:MAG TPA: UDP-N-acetylmuramoyl-L-alanyl-D-glutamate--2,6-diaminopimelate ligase [Planctomycetota bacterium]|nr:UDP-N-acetylmuramoyl-L-alanyl-D-glutamate--2,6-diaminopimelate ligase [Planctomycetota bacterium]
MKLGLVLEGITSSSAAAVADQNSIEISGLCCDSRQVKKGDMFFAVSGTKLDGVTFAKDAAAKGAAAVVADATVTGLSIPVITVENTRLAMGVCARNFHRDPAAVLKVIGVTGTNGKSTTAYLIRHVLNTLGLRCGMLGTIENDLGDEIQEAHLTTPESLDIFASLARMRDAGCRAAVMETSSHALYLDRVAAVDFDAAVLTNLTQDHLDFHKTMDQYRDAKTKLFANLGQEATAVLNGADAACKHFQSATHANILRYGIGSNRQYPLSAQVIQQSVGGTCFRLSFRRRTADVDWKLVGRHNVENALAAVAAVMSLGVPLTDIAGALNTFAGVPGRLTRVDEGQDFGIFVDYAHTDDALKNILTALRTLTQGRIITVFGCGGDRDRGKRPKMGGVVEQMADLPVVTSDNPRSENPVQIVAEILRGMKFPQRALVEIDRQTAIEKAIGLAKTGDVVVIAGKGHEDYQIFADRTIHFDDREVAAAAVQALGVAAAARKTA